MSQNLSTTRHHYLGTKSKQFFTCFKMLDKTTSNWKEFWNLRSIRDFSNDGPVYPLSYHALRCAMMHLVECLFKLQKVMAEKYGIDETLHNLYFNSSENIIANNYERIKRFLSGKEIQAIIDYFEPCRQIFIRTDLTKVFGWLMRIAVIPYGDKYKNGDTNHYDNYLGSEDNLLTLLFWLCFKNFDSDSLLLHQVGETRPDQLKSTKTNYKTMFDLVFDYITNNRYDMKRCTTLELCIEKSYPGHRSYPSIRTLQRFFAKFPNLKSLDIDDRTTKETDGEITEMAFIYDKKDIFSIISKIELTTLKIHLNELQAKDFCHYLTRAPKTLKHLVFRYEREMRNGEWTWDCTEKSLSNLIKILKALKVQKNLTSIAMDIFIRDVTPELVASVQEEVESPIDHVTTIILESPSTMIMKLIDKYFINVNNLTIIMPELGQEHEKKSIPVLNNFKSVKFFKIIFMDDSGDKDYEEPKKPSNIFSDALGNFPNLTDLHMTFCNAIDPENVPTNNSVKELVLDGGYITPPYLVSKMPKLEKIISVYEVCESPEENETMKKLLPHNCKIIENIEGKEEYNSLFEVGEYYFATKLLLERWDE